jgi:hypothetical protein
VGHFLENFFKGAGRYDLRFLGDRGASLVLHGTRIDLWHPLKGKGYADSYPLQRHISAMEPVRRPHILLTGHWHTFCYILDQGVHAFACPTFQGGSDPGDSPGNGRARIMMRGGQRSSGLDVNKVRLPRADDYRPPKEIREEILNALKEKYPKTYESIIHKYFKRLAE